MNYFESCKILYSHYLIQCWKISIFPVLAGIFPVISHCCNCIRTSSLTELPVVYNPGLSYKFQLHIFGQIHTSIFKALFQFVVGRWFNRPVTLSLSLHWSETKFASHWNFDGRPSVIVPEFIFSVFAAISLFRVVRSAWCTSEMCFVY